MPGGRRARSASLRRECGGDGWRSRSWGKRRERLRRRGTWAQFRAIYLVCQTKLPRNGPVENFVSWLSIPCRLKRLQVEGDLDEVRFAFALGGQGPLDYGRADLGVGHR